MSDCRCIRGTGVGSAELYYDCKVACGSEAEGCQKVVVTRAASSNSTQPFFNQEQNFCPVENNPDCFTYLDRQTLTAWCSLKDFFSDNCYVDVPATICVDPTQNKSNGFDPPLATALRKIFYKGEREACVDYIQKTPGAGACTLKEFLSEGGCFIERKYQVCVKKAENRR